MVFGDIQIRHLKFKVENFDDQSWEVELCLLS